MKRKVSVVLALLASVCVFSTTAFVALANNSTYENYKKGLIELAEKGNYEAEGSFKLSNGNEVIYEQNFVRVIEKDKSYINEKISRQGEQIVEYASYIAPEEHIYYTNGKISSKVEFDPYYSQTEPFSNNEKRLINALIDLVIGDAKNYMISDQNRIYATITEEQVPEVVQTGFAVIAEQVQTFNESYNSEYSTNEERALKEIMTLSDASIKKISGEGELDENNNIKSLVMSIEIGGTGSSGYKNLIADIKVNLKNVGSAKVTKPDITEYASDYHEENYKDYSVTFSEDGENIENFTVDENGSIKITMPENKDVNTLVPAENNDTENSNTQNNDTENNDTENNLEENNTEDADLEETPSGDASTPDSQLNNVEGESETETF